MFVTLCVHCGEHYIAGGDESGLILGSRLHGGCMDGRRDGILGFLAFFTVLYLYMLYSPLSG